ncbi:FAD-dependent oxidoreductase [Rhodobacterales bacterium]|nr:FAD-dependent oxidoreductase [Rhodobacterales bacterium]
MAEQYEVVVVGGGTVGLSAATQAAMRGYKTLLIDQYGIDNDMNSSKGYERMYRVLYAPENRARLVESAYAMWHELESDAGFEILVEHPMLFFGNATSQTFEGSLQQIRDTMDQLGIPYDYHSSPQEIANAFPVFNPNGMPSYYAGLSQNMGATILVQKSFEAYQALASKHKVDIITAEVTQISTEFPQNPPYLITVDGDSAPAYEAQYLIMAPGIWLNDALKFFNLQAAVSNPSPEPNWSIWTMTLGYYNTMEPARNDLPIWYEFGDNNKTYYGFQPTGAGPEPVMDDFPYAIKIAADFTYNTTTNVTTALNTPYSQAILGEIQNHLNSLFVPGVIDSSVLSGSQGACNYSMAPDGDMVIGKIPTAPGSQDYWPNAAMFIMASGRGFKFTPLWGRILVDLAVNGTTAYENDIAPFSPSRNGVLETL